MEPATPAWVRIAKTDPFDVVDGRGSHSFNPGYHGYTVFGMAVLISSTHGVVEDSKTAATVPPKLKTVMALADGSRSLTVATDGLYRATRLMGFVG